MNRAQHSDRGIHDLLRMTIGFDDLFRLSTFQPPSFPPYDIFNLEKDNAYLIEVALAGYKPNDIEVSFHQGTLTISSEGVPADETQKDSVLYKGIAKRSFRLRFAVSEQVEIHGASLTDGILRVLLRRTKKQDAIERIPISNTSVLESK